jgi:oligopeptide transport system substrate-binding protein
MKISKILLAASTLGATALTLAACGQKNGQAKQTLNWMTTAEVPTMDSSKSYDSSSNTQLSNVDEGLFRSGKGGKIEPALAKSVKTNHDETTWLIKLRKSQWSNGDPVTAKDFVYSWQRSVNPKTAAQNAYLFAGVVKNASQIEQKKMPVAKLGIKALGKYQLKIDLAAHTPYFKQLLSEPLFYPQNQKVVEKYGSKYGTASKYTVYNGPFVQKGWNASSLNWQLVKNQHYWDKQAVKLDKINFSVQKTPSTSYNLYQQGKLDTTFLDSTQTKQLKHNHDYLLRPNAGTEYIEFNQQDNHDLKNANIRKAIGYAIDRQALCQSLGGANQPANTLTAKNLVKVKGQDYTNLVAKSAKEMASLNKAKAQKYYRLGLKQLGKKNISFSLLFDDNDAGKRVTETLQSQLEANLPGLKVKVQNVPYKTRLTRAINQQFDVVVTSWSADFADPISFLQLVQSQNDNNDGKYHNAAFDAALAKAGQSNNDEQRYHYLTQAENVVLKTAGITPLYYPNQAWLMKSKVKGLIYSATGGYNFKKTYIN